MVVVAVIECCMLARALEALLTTRRLEHGELASKGGSVEQARLCLHFAVTLGVVQVWSAGL